MILEGWLRKTTKVPIVLKEIVQQAGNQEKFQLEKQRTC